jgi:hypothetical protein
MSDHQAWNNFVMANEPELHEAGSERRAAATACRFSGLANNGGLNSFLTATFDLNPREVVEALISIGAPKAAHQLGRVLRGLKAPLGVSSEQARWNALDRHWTDALDEIDTLSEEADAELTAALERHVERDHHFYLSLA